eukprot:TRINITY_DN1361_c1_g1_i1.p1 TRINITY_DN1361_c1_g1~~TRINITY_DN1361_c1_g1_i1.p1  ORF type:complete len:328 (-),score=73.71 TRINITY_DN1361_c1_g1_i1:76-1059(-)
MTLMCQRLIGSVLIATFICCSDAACMSDDAVKALYESLPQRVSPACQKSMAADEDASPPQCKEDATACGFLVYINTSVNCTGKAESCSMVMSQLPSNAVSSQKLPVPQTCIPDACRNDAASMSEVMQFATESYKAATCRQSGFDETLASYKDQLQLMGVSVELVLTAGSAMSCDKNSGGQIVIDGMIIPEPVSDTGDSTCEDGPQTDGKFKLCIGSSDCRVPNNYCGEGECDDASGVCIASVLVSGGGSSSSSSSTTTCGDVKQAYKAAGCCGNPQKAFPMPSRRLSEEDELLEAVKAELRRAEAEEGATKARALAKSIDDILAHFA